MEANWEKTLADLEAEKEIYGEYWGDVLSDVHWMSTTWVDIKEKYRGQTIAVSKRRVYGRCDTLDEGLVLEDERLVDPAIHKMVVETFSAPNSPEYLLTVAVHPGVEHHIMFALKDEVI